ncbi:hypothetical protein LLG88_13640 [bacterium]|nr:hypothetical protein [bacterium]
MNWAAVADVIQVVQAAMLILGLIIAIGMWRQRTDSTPAALSQRMDSCRAQCDRELSRLNADLASFARKDTIEATLQGIDTRLANIERAMRIGPAEE